MQKAKEVNQMFGRCLEKAGVLDSVKIVIGINPITKEANAFDTNAVKVKNITRKGKLHEQ